MGLLGGRSPPNNPIYPIIPAIPKERRAGGSSGFLNEVQYPNV